MAIIINDANGASWSLGIDAQGRLTTTAVPVQAPTGNLLGQGAIPVSTLLTNALLEINAFQQGETIPAEDSAFALSKLNRILDQWNARRAYVYNISFTSYTLTPNHQPHLIGPGLSSPDFAAAVRPVEIIAANIVMTSVTPNVRVPLSIRDDAWWAANTVQGISTSLPTDLYYSDDWPSGALYLWPIPTTAYKLELFTRGILSSLTANASFSLPPGYEEAITLTLAEALSGPYDKPVTPSLASAAMRARAAIQSLNSDSPRTSFAGTGLPGGTRRGSFNYYSGR